MPAPSSGRKSVSQYVKGILQGDRVMLARAITLAESSLPSDYALAGEVVAKIIEKTGNSLRIGITGVPGAGKSTFIEALGKYLTGKKKKVAVLTVDPSSRLTKGSILGDKTRMEALSADPLAFIRPSPAGDSAGGIARKTREAMLLCEAAGYEIILIETVGVGQSETKVHDMTDCFLLMLLTGSGDELQIIKRGIMEMADVLLINKADGKNLPRAEKLKKEISQVMHFMNRNIPVLTCSALEQKGIAEVWDKINTFIKEEKKKGKFEEKRKFQNINFMKERISEMLLDEFFRNKSISSALQKMEIAVKDGKISPVKASEKLFKIFKRKV